MVVQAIKSKSDFIQAIQSNENVVIDFSATWCGPCRVISPVFERLSDQILRVKFFSMDVDEVPDVAAEMGVRAMPTFIFFRKGEKSDTLLGADPGSLENMIELNSRF